MSTDLYLLDDLDPSMPLVSGRTALAQAVLHRLSTPPGDPNEGGAGLINLPEYGIDLRNFLNSALSAGDLRQLERRTEQQVLEDDRVESVRLRIDLDVALSIMTIEVSLIDAQGPFDLQIEIDDVTISLLRGP